VVEIIEAEADDLAGARHRQSVCDAGERPARGRWRALGEIGERGEIAIVGCENVGEVAGQPVVHGLQVDDLVGLYDAEARTALRFKSDDFHV
jgi:hypothetical protein